MKNDAGGKMSLKQRNEELRALLLEAEENLEAIRSGKADAIVVQTGEGTKVFTIQGAEIAYRIMVETMYEGAITLDAEGIVMYANTRFCEMLAIPCANLVGKPVQTIVAKSRLDDLEMFLKKTHSGSCCHQDFEFLRRDSSEIPVYLSSAPLDISGRHDICVIVSDLTERVLSQHKLLELNNSLEQKIKERTRELEKLTTGLEHKVNERTSQVRELAKALSLAEQKQRQRLSAVLHENLQQTLFATKSRFGLLKASLSEGAGEELKEDIAELEKLTEKALDTTKQLAIEFNPPVLRNEGLDSALRWLADHFQKRYGLHVTVDVSKGFLVIREEERLLIVNLIRELLANIARHAKTTAASVSVNRVENHIVIAVEDKGVGFDPEQEKKIARGKAHMGLFSIEERLRFFGGTLHIHSRPGSGTRIVMSLPYDPKQKQLGVE